MSARILVVEDQPMLRQLLTAMFSKTGYEVESCPDGAEALRVIKQHPPDLIISDLMMPGIDGYQLCTTLKSAEQTRHIPFVMLTTKPLRHDQGKAFECGADFYVEKPVVRERLQKIVTSLLDKA